MPTRKQKPKTYEQLRAEWYEKLKNEGFNDIEQSPDKLKIWSTTFYLAVPNSSTPIQLAAKETYYRLAGHFLNEYKFKTPRDRIIWEYHSNGMSMRNIVETLSKVKIKTNRDAVCKIIQVLAATMKKKYGVTK